MRTGDAKTSYAADEALWTSAMQWVWFGLLLLALVLLPAWGSNYVVYLACLVGIAVISATGPG